MVRISDWENFLRKYEEARQLITEQFKSIHKTIEKKREAEELANQHFWDEDHKNKLPSHIIRVSKKKLQHIKTKDRAIYVLMKSGEFTFKEISHLITTSLRNTKRRYYRTTQLV